MKNKTKAKPAVCPGDIVEIRFGSGENFQEYCTVEAGEELRAIALVDRGVHVINLEGKRAEFRIIRKRMGTKLIYGPKV